MVTTLIGNERFLSYRDSAIWHGEVKQAWVWLIEQSDDRYNEPDDQQYFQHNWLLLVGLHETADIIDGRMRRI